MKYATIPLALGCALFMVILAVSACTTSLTVHTAPLGPVSITGSLIPAEMSLLRRGTHVLLIDGKRTYYVESKTVNLVNLEGQTVHIEGTAQLNTNKKDLPLLIASTVLATMNDATLHDWEIPALDLKISLPALWRASIRKNIVTFMLPQEQLPLLTISVLSGSVLPAGSPYYLSGHRAIRVLSGSGSRLVEDIVVQDRGFSLQLHFDVSTQQSIKRPEDAKLIRGQFQRALSTLTFLSDRSAQDPVISSGAVVPCGGPAGLLCPQGSFCNVMDTEMRIGVCKKL